MMATLGASPPSEQKRKIHELGVHDPIVHAMLTCAERDGWSWEETLQNLCVALAAAKAEMHAKRVDELMRAPAALVVPQAVWRERCHVFRAGRCDGTKRTRCGSCGAEGHGNCYGNGRRAGDVECENICSERRWAVEIIGVTGAPDDIGVVCAVSFTGPHAERYAREFYAAQFAPDPAGGLQMVRLLGPPPKEATP